jgi:hypothetical protein
MFFDISIGIHIDSQLNTFFVADISSKIEMFAMSENRSRNSMQHRNFMHICIGLRWWMTWKREHFDSFWYYALTKGFAGGLCPSEMDLYDSDGSGWNAAAWGFYG